MKTQQQEKDGYETEEPMETPSNTDWSTVESSSGASPVQPPDSEISEQKSTEESSSTEHTENWIITSSDPYLDSDYVPEWSDVDENIASSSELEKSANENIFVRGGNRSPPGEWWTSSYALREVDVKDPSTYRRAISGVKSDKWWSAVISEMSSLPENKTRMMDRRDMAKNVLTAKWVYKNEETCGAFGALEQLFKAKFVTRGFRQVKGTEF